MAKYKRRRARRIAPVEPVVNEFTAQHGDYGSDTLALTAGDLDATRPEQRRVTRNRGGTTVERWITNGSLTPAQVEAIGLYARAYRVRFGGQRVVANWSVTNFIRGGDIEEWVDGHLDAKRWLDEIDREVLSRLPSVHRDVWQNVVLWDEAAGVAGARLGYRSKTAEASAKVVVLLIADMIAVALKL